MSPMTSLLPAERVGDTGGNLTATVEAGDACSGETAKKTQLFPCELRSGSHHHDPPASRAERHRAELYPQLELRTESVNLTIFWAVARWDRSTANPPVSAIRLDSADELTNRALRFRRQE